MSLTYHVVSNRGQLLLRVVVILDEGGTVKVDEKAPVARRSPAIAEHQVVVADIAVQDVPLGVQSFVGCKNVRN